MRYVVILTTVAVYFLILSITLTNINADNFLVQADQGNSTFVREDVSTGQLNLTTDGLTDTKTSNYKAFINSLSIMFSFSLPTLGFPVGLAVFIKSINWLLLLLVGVSIYKIGNPISSA